MKKDTLQQIFHKLGSIEQKLDDLNGSVKHHDKKIDVLENDCSRLQEAFRPIKKAYYKMADWSMGFIILIGTVTIAVFMYLKDKLL